MTQVLVRSRRLLYAVTISHIAVSIIPMSYNKNYSSDEAYKNWTTVSDCFFSVKRRLILFRLSQSLITAYSSPSLLVPTR